MSTTDRACLTTLQQSCLSLLPEVVGRLEVIGRAGVALQRRRIGCTARGTDTVLHRCIRACLETGSRQRHQTAKWR
ncbi:hypothetical protein [Xanthomonas arboricola]|uniref:hypothetical protein n=1 Tax=Xanthomonas arboricola TaxID=56448 RepID=UPI0015E3F202|nr:hypothetical protein [Xanthomonas arboricola]